MCVVEKPGIEPMTLGTEAERAANYTTRPGEIIIKSMISLFNCSCSRLPLMMYFKIQRNRLLSQANHVLLLRRLKDGLKIAAANGIQD